MLNSATLNLIATVLADAENFLAGKPIEVTIPAETFEVAGVKVSVPALNVTLTK